MSPVPFRVKALYEYSSPHEDDLSFNPGVIITVTDEEDADWYGGEYVDDSGVKHEGIFPRNFVEKFEPQPPPRPTRSRTKKDAEPAPASAPVPEPGHQPDADNVAEAQPELKHTQGVNSDDRYTVEAQPVASPPSLKDPEVSAPAPVKGAEHPSEPVSELASPPLPATAASTSEITSKPASASSKPSGPPPVSSKPSGNTFKDRIAAFNKPAAAPVPSFKPSSAGSGSSGFVKKPFVAPPPSRNAYVPPPQQPPAPKAYRREEDPDIKEQEAETQESAEKAGFGTAVQTEEGDGDQPKPTSLKDRIALLQKQQREQAQRHADAAAKKDKPKRPAKNRADSHDVQEPGLETAVSSVSHVPEGYEIDDSARKTSIESERLPPPPRRKSSKGPSAAVAEPYHDGNEADMSGAGDTTEGQEDVTEREDSDERPRGISRAPTSTTLEPGKSLEKQQTHGEEEGSAEERVKEEGEEDEEEEEEDSDFDPEVRRREELRARMAKMSGGMNLMGQMFGPPPSASAASGGKKKKAHPEAVEEQVEEEVPVARARGAPPVPVPGMMALPGMGTPRPVEEHGDAIEPEVPTSPGASRAPPPPPPSARPVKHEVKEEEEVEDEVEEEDEDEATPSQHPSRTPIEASGPPPIPGGRPAPPSVPNDSRQVPPTPAAVASQSEGSESGDELSGPATVGRPKLDTTSHATRAPPPVPITAPSTRPPPPVPSSGDDVPPMSPTESVAPPPSKRSSRPPPPIPGAAPALPPAPPSQSRPPPPPPPAATLSRQSTQDVSTAVPVASPTRPHEAGQEEEGEVTEYEGDYDTDIGSSVPHKDALKAHARDSSLEDTTSIKSPVVEAPASPPPVPSASAPRAIPPPIPTQAPQPPVSDKRKSVDMPRAAPPPPPPAKDASQAYDEEEEYDPFNYAAPKPGGYYTQERTPKVEADSYFQQSQQAGPSSPLPQTRAPPPPPANRASARQSFDVNRASTTIRRSMDAHRPSMESGFIANDVDLAQQSGWWRQPNQVPPVLQGRRDLYFEMEESTSTNQDGKTLVTRNIYILFQDHSQTILTVQFDPDDPSDVELDQRHQSPPRTLRQDELEQSYERFGRAIASAVASKKDSVVADGTPQSLIHELLRPFKDALAPVGTRAYGALVYSNLANASTQQNDEIRPGDIVSIRNAKFQGKHGPMHAKYTAEVGKPDHVAVVAEWDGTKKKVKAWEQGRENKKVKIESFKLDDLRSGEVKVWRVMPRSWVGWNSQP